MAVHGGYEGSCNRWRGLSLSNFPLFPFLSPTWSQYTLSRRRQRGREAFVADYRAAVAFLISPPSVDGQPGASGLLIYPLRQ